MLFRSGVTFHQEYKLRTVLWQFEGQELTPDEKNQLEKFNVDLEQYLTDAEIEALRMRISHLLQEGAFPFPPTQWPAIPWPIY